MKGHADFQLALRVYVRALLDVRGLSQMEFSRRLGWRQSSVSQMLSGTRAGTLKRWEEVARFFGMPLWQLFYRASLLMEAGDK